MQKEGPIPNGGLNTLGGPSQTFLQNTSYQAHRPSWGGSNYNPRPQGYMGGTFINHRPHQCHGCMEEQIWKGFPYNTLSTIY